MIEFKTFGFYPFVLNLPDYLVKKIVWDEYYHTKGKSGMIPYLKGKNAGKFAALCLLKEYGVMKKNGEMVRQCNYLFYQIFLGMPMELMGDIVREMIVTSEPGLTYEEYIRVVKFILNHYGKWLEMLEFSREGERETSRLRYQKFREETEGTLTGWQTVQQDAIKRGMDIQFLTLDFNDNFEIEKFFLKQEKDIERLSQGYESLPVSELFSVYQTILQIPCKTKNIEVRLEQIRNRLEQIEKKHWQDMLDKLKETVNLLEFGSNQVFFGDNLEKCREAENIFASTGAFEWILLYHDSSGLLNGKQGMAVTTKKIYYRTRLISGEIDIGEVAGFTFAGTTFSQKLVVTTKKGKKYFLPCNIEKSNHYKYLKVLEELLNIIGTEN